MNNKGVHIFIISTFVLLYLVVSVISTIHVVDFFEITNPTWLSIFLAIAFEIGAAASLASIVVLDKMNKFIVWSLFFVLTAMQAIGNTYFAYTHLSDFTAWSELFGLSEEEPIFQKRILSIISGAILPLVSLGFIKALVDYIRPSEKSIEEKDESGEIFEEYLNSDNQTEESEEKINGTEEEKIGESEPIKQERKLKDTIYYDLDPTKIT
jgi:hypothetical protein